MNGSFVAHLFCLHLTSADSYCLIHLLQMEQIILSLPLCLLMQRYAEVAAGRNSTRESLKRVILTPRHPPFSSPPVLPAIITLKCPQLHASSLSIPFTILHFCPSLPPRPLLFHHSRPTFSQVGGLTPRGAPFFFFSTFF